jgi:MoaA/NifB/PqqE/SkfB family radical SAM enzyme
MSNGKEAFCILPFVEFNLNPNGGVKPCCAFGRFVSKDGKPMSVYEHSIDEIWNSEDLLKVRQRMIDGRPEPGCGYCIKMESAGMRSLRDDANEMWETNSVYNPTLEKIPAIKERVTKSNFRLTGGGQMLNLDVGNLCNLKCRMCHSSASSMIANDPVHSKWSHVDPVVARWKGTELVFAPRPVLGVKYTGFTALDRRFDADVIWAKTEGSISLPVPAGSTALAFSIQVQTGELRLWATIHGFEPQLLLLKQGTNEVKLPLVATTNKNLTVSFTVGGQSLIDNPEHYYFGIEKGAYMRAETGRSNVAFSRFPSGDQWFQNIDFLVKEIFAHPDQIRQVNLVGGEPMLIRQCMDVIRHLVDSGVAKNIVLQVTTNGMVLPDGWLELAAQFRQVTLTFSLDGYGPISEYIRFPSVWTEIQANIDKFMTLKNAYFLVNTTVQVYNMLHVVDMIRFCDERKIEFRYHFLQGPAHLSPLVMPASIREEAASRIRRFAQRNDTEGAGRSTHVANRDVWLSQLADAFLVEQPNWDDKKLKEFMAFTNDLDGSRGQNFRTALPELYEMIVAEGYEWNPATRHHKAA